MGQSESRRTLFKLLMRLQELSQLPCGMHKVLADSRARLKNLAVYSSTKHVTASSAGIVIGFLPTLALLLA
jgi:hypothetical protein